MKSAVIQMNAGKNKTKNLITAAKLIDRAIRNNAKLIVLPEAFIFRGRPQSLRGNAEKIPGETTLALMSIARKKKVLILQIAVSMSPLREIGNQY